MPMTAGLVAVLLVLVMLTLSVLLLIRRRSLRRADHDADGPEGADSRDELDGTDDDSAEPVLVRVLRVQVRTLEQALVELEAASLDLSDTASVAQRADDPSTPAPTDPGFATVLVMPVPEVRVTLDDHTPLPVATEATEVPRTPASDPDVVLPVPPLPLPEPPRGHRWFRRSAA